MKIFLIGGKGFLGQVLIKKLIENKHEVTAIYRQFELSDGQDHYGKVKWIEGDILEHEKFLDQLTDTELIIYTARPYLAPDKRITKEILENLREQTNYMFINSLKLAIRLKTPIILTNEAGFVTPKGEIADETFPVSRNGLTKVNTEIDSLVNNAFDTGKPEIIQFLCGRIYGNGGIFKNYYYNQIKKRKFVITGNGNNYIPRIHVDDLANAYIKAIEKMPVRNKFIITDDTHCTVKEFYSYMANRMDVPVPKCRQNMLAKLTKGKIHFEGETIDCKLTNQKAQEVLDWHPSYPNYKMGIDKVISEIEKSDN